MTGWGVSDLKGREQEIYEKHYFELARKTDRLFGAVFVFQWLLGIALALWVSPLTWVGSQSTLHLHVYMAVFLGGATSALPVYLAWKYPGQTLNRYVMATAQIFYSMLLIHFTGGRIETHFHIFGSLAFLAFYRDYKPVLLATAITAADHLLRGYFMPESVYGVLSASPLRALEHAAWVVFEDVILFASIRMGLEELHTIARQQAEVENHLASVEELVQKRTQELKESQDRIVSQQQALISSAKMSALGEMAGGVAHEINTPLAVISLRVEQMQECVAEGDLEGIDFKKALQVIKKTTERIAKIVNGLRFFAREGQRCDPQNVKLSMLVEETLGFCQERFANHGVQLHVENEENYSEVELECRPIEISQVLLNLLNNAYDAIETRSNKWIRLSTRDYGDSVQITVTDCGDGISLELQDKIMQPFFSTKDIGKGTGLGLSISKGIIDEHNGKLYVDNTAANTTFVVVLPKQQKTQKGQVA